MHEKTILLPLLPAVMLARREPVVTLWFSVIAAFSLWPLLVKVDTRHCFKSISLMCVQDELMLAYAGSMLLFVTVGYVHVRPTMHASPWLATLVRAVTVKPDTA